MLDHRKYRHELLRCDVLGHRWIATAEPADDDVTVETCTRCGAVETRFDLTEVVGLAS